MVIKKCDCELHGCLSREVKRYTMEEASMTDEKVKRSLIPRGVKVLSGKI